MSDTFESKIQSIRTHFTETLATMRTGRAHPSIVSGVLVEAYGAKTPLPHLANISVADARMIVIEPWDKSNIKAVEKAIVEAQLNLTPTVDGTTIRIHLPEMTEETRKNLVKKLHERLEEARISVRQAREEDKRAVESDFKSDAITEDDRYALIEKLDKKTKEAVSELETLAENKEKEIMTV